MKIQSIFNQSSTTVHSAIASSGSKAKLNGLMAQVGMMQLQIPEAARYPVSNAIAEAEMAISNGDEEALQEQIARVQKMLKMIQEMMLLQASLSMMAHEEDEEEEDVSTANSLVADTRSYQQVMLNNSVQKLMELVGGSLGYDQQIQNINVTVNDSLRSMLGL